MSANILWTKANLKQIVNTQQQQLMVIAKTYKKKFPLSGVTDWCFERKKIVTFLDRNFLNRVS